MSETEKPASPLDVNELPSPEAVVSGKVKVKGEGLGSKFKSTFFSGDAKTAIGFIGTMVIVPAMKKMIADMGMSFMQQILYGNGRAPQTGNTSYTSYSQMGTPPQMMGGRPGTFVGPNPSNALGALPHQPPLQFNVNPHETSQVIFANREDAVRVLETMLTYVDQFNICRLSDFYTLAGQQTTPIQFKWGWTDIPNAQVVQGMNGFSISLPPAIQLSA